MTAECVSLYMKVELAGGAPKRMGVVRGLRTGGLTLGLTYGSTSSAGLSFFCR